MAATDGENSTLNVVEDTAMDVAAALDDDGENDDSQWKDKTEMKIIKVDTLIAVVGVVDDTDFHGHCRNT